MSLNQTLSGAGSKQRPATPAKVWVGALLIGVVLAIVPFVLGMAGQSWVRTLNFALLYVMLALGLNIVVGFAGLLDLGYIGLLGTLRLLLPQFLLLLGELFLHECEVLVVLC